MDSDSASVHVCEEGGCYRDLRHCLRALLSCETTVALQGERSDAQLKCMRERFRRVCADELAIDLAGIEMLFEHHAPHYVLVIFQVDD